MLFQRQPSWHGSSLSQMPRGRRPHHQSKFYTARLRAGTRWSSTVFAHELSQRAASFEPENGLYSFALTMPAGGVRRFDDSQSASFVSHAVLSPRAESAAYSAKRAPCAWLRDVFIANAADRTAELSLARRRHGAAVRRSRIVRRWRQTRATACPELGSESTHPRTSAPHAGCMADRLEDRWYGLNAFDRRNIVAEFLTQPSRGDQHFLLQ